MVFWAGTHPNFHHPFWSPLCDLVFLLCALKGYSDVLRT